MKSTTVKLDTNIYETVKLVKPSSTSHWISLAFHAQDFVTGLSILSRGSVDEKLRWTFSLYDINGDGCITREEMTDIVTAVYELMGKFSDPTLNHGGIQERVDRIFQVSAFSYLLISHFYSQKVIRNQVPLYVFVPRQRGFNDFP